MAVPQYQIPVPVEFITSSMELTPVFRVTAPSRFPDGFTTVADVADPYWQLRAVMDYAPIYTATKLRAWKAMLRGGQKTFLFPHCKAPFPRSYANKPAVLALTRSGGGAFNGAATAQSLPSATEIAFTTGSSLRLPANFDLKIGDVVSLVKSGARPKYSLHMIVEDVTANASGVATITVEPRINLGIFSAGDVVNFVDPLGEFTLNPEAQSDGMVSKSDNSFQIEATSYLRA